MNPSWRFINLSLVLQALRSVPLPVTRVVSPIMSALSAQLLRLQKQQKEEEDHVEIDEMTLTDLEEQVIMFGKTKMGCKFPEAFADTQWTRFVVSKFESSTKKEHRMYILSGMCNSVSTRWKRKSSARRIGTICIRHLWNLHHPRRPKRKVP